MDNKAYLDEIAVKGKRKSTLGPILTPVMIKLIAAGIVAVIAMVVIGGVLSSKNAETAAIHETVYARIAAFSDENGILEPYQDRLKSSDLRAYTLTLQTTLTTAKTSIERISDAIKLNPDNLSSGVTEENESEISSMDDDLYDAYLNGKLESVYASTMVYQISQLISLELQARSKTNNADYAAVLDQSVADLTNIQKSFKQYSDTH